MSKHVSIEDIILDRISNEDMKHIYSCKECNKLYSSIFKPIPSDVIETVDNKIKNNLLLKFREMKSLGYLNDGIKARENNGFSHENGRLLKYIAISLAFLVFVVITFTLLYVGNLNKINDIKLSHEGKVDISLSNISRDDISVKIDGSTIKIYVDAKVNNFTIHGIPKGNFKNIRLVVGGQIYEFFASEFNASYSGGKLIVNNSFLEPRKEPIFRNEVILNDGSVIRCNVEEIGDSFVIINTELGKRRLNKSDIAKIKYIH